jgi:glucose 1-dehydrogenase
MRDRFDLTGRRALVTGSSRGIGRAILLALAEYGADVVVHYVGNAAAADETAAAARAFGGRVAVICGDIGVEGEPLRLAREAEAAHAPLDILVLNASAEERVEWPHITPEGIQRQVDVNLRATVQFIQAVVPGMMTRGWGRVVTLGSVQQVKPNPQMGVYAATKSAQLTFIRSIAAQVGLQGVTINNLAPGAVLTDRNAAVFNIEDNMNNARSWIPIGRLGRTDEMVGAALLLCSDAGSYITGLDLLVDGGRHVAYP